MTHRHMSGWHTRVGSMVYVKPLRGMFPVDDVRRADDRIAEVLVLGEWRSTLCLQSNCRPPAGCSVQLVVPAKLLSRGRVARGGASRFVQRVPFGKRPELFHVDVAEELLMVCSALRAARLPRASECATLLTRYAFIYHRMPKNYTENLLDLDPAKYKVMFTGGQNKD